METDLQVAIAAFTLMIDDRLVDNLYRIVNAHLKENKLIERNMKMDS